MVIRRKTYLGGCLYSTYVPMKTPSSLETHVAHSSTSRVAVTLVYKASLEASSTTSESSYEAAGVHTYKRLVGYNGLSEKTTWIPLYVADTVLVV